MASKIFSGIWLRLATLVFPPLGLCLLWRDKRTLKKKILGTVGILLFLVLYAALIVVLLIRFTGMQIEWRGGYLPKFTYHKTKTDYAALAASRAAQTNLAATSTLIRFPTPYWTGFRGANRDGRYDEQPILTNWPADGLKCLWRQPCGGGYASFSIANGLAFTIEQRKDDEVVVAYELETGREVWTNGWVARFTEYFSDEGPRATPTYDDGKIFALGAEGEFRCLDATTGKTLWRKNILSDSHAVNVTYGMSASPLIVGEKVIVQPGGKSGLSVVAYNKLDGATIWKSLRDEAAYSSPMVVELARQRQLLVVTVTRGVGLAVEDGELLWETPWIVPAENRNIAQPLLLSSNRFLLSAGYGKGCEAVEISRTESGTAAESGTAGMPSLPGFSARPVWQNKNLKNKFTSSVFWDGHIYGLDEDILVCLDAQTGERRWKDGRYGYGQVLLADGHLIVLGGGGVLALVKASPEKFEELARFQAIHGKTWNHPAIAHGKILVRNAVEMACFELSGK